jgi:Domain of unknown function (DUF6371)/Zinc beta-ribbon finger, putative
MNVYRFILDTTSKKFYCPMCNKKTFVRYIDTFSSNYLPEIYGRCDREIKCGHFLNPYKDGYSKIIESKNNRHITQRSGQIKINPKPGNNEPAFIPFEILEATRKGYDQNSFIQNLLFNIPFPFPVKAIENVISLYHLGTICKGYRAGAITFPFIDINGNIRAIQTKRFDKLNHTLNTDFIHSILEKHYARNNKPLPIWLIEYLQVEKKVSCFFGEHLLKKYSENPIALVEAPKTAIIATMYFGLPNNSKNLLWLAVYNLSSLTIERCEVLTGRKVFLFPDLNGFSIWKNKVNGLENNISNSTFTVSDLLQNHASVEDKDKGLDIADFLINMNWRDFCDREKPDKKNEVYLSHCSLYDSCVWLGL